MPASLIYYLFILNINFPLKSWINNQEDKLRPSPPSILIRTHSHSTAFVLTRIPTVDSSHLSIVELRFVLGIDPVLGMLRGRLLPPRAVGNALGSYPTNCPNAILIRRLVINQSDDRRHFKMTVEIPLFLTLKRRRPSCVLILVLLYACFLLLISSTSFVN